MNTKNNQQTELNFTNDAQKVRREILTKMAKLAAITPVAFSTLITPQTSAAPKSCRGNGKVSC